MQMKCQYCGHENFGMATFCAKCGNRLIPSESTPYQSSAVTPRQPKKEFLGGLPKTASGVILGFVFIGIGILLVIYSMMSIMGSTAGAGDDPFGTVKGILGGFAIMIVGALFAAFGGIILFIGSVYFLVKVADRK